MKNQVEHHLKKKANFRKIQTCRTHVITTAQCDHKAPPTAYSFVLIFTSAWKYSSAKISNFLNF